MMLDRPGSREPEPLSTGYILALADPACGDRRRVGGKAAVLAGLLQAGFPVPDGFVLTTEAFDAFLLANQLGRDSAPEAVLAAPLLVELDRTLRAAAQALGKVPLAVRSSGVAEDLADASFAGQYETVLDVRGAEALADAVRRCWASAFSQRVATYRAAQVQQHSGSLAVLVQRLVPAEAAGVAFTANPVTGDRSETVVSAVRGLGERLVSGQASPDEWLVSGEEVVCRSAPESAVDAAQVRAIAALARKVERHFGSPQDIEWAIAGGELFLLQARPITALPEPLPEPIPVPINVPEGFWERDASHFPVPLSPLARVFLTGDNGTRRMCDEFGFLIEQLDTREIGGWIYSRVVPPGGKDGPAPPNWLMPLLVRLVPSLRRRIKTCVDAIRSDKAGHYAQRWYDEWRPALQARIEALRDVDLPALSDVALEEHFTRTIALADHAWDVHFLVGGAAILMQGEFAFVCRDLLGWSEGQMLELVSGLSERSSEPSRRLAELAHLAAERPAVRALLQQVTDQTPERLAEVDPAFAAAFTDYQHQFGCRAALRGRLPDDGRVPYAGARAGPRPACPRL